MYCILSLADSRAAKNIPKGHDWNFEDTDAMSMHLLQREISNISIYPLSLCEFFFIIIISLWWIMRCSTCDVVEEVEGEGEAGGLRIEHGKLRIT